METINAISGLSALAHESRLDLFQRLVQAGPNGIPAGALAKEAGLNFTTASAQLATLAQAGLVRRQRLGRSIIYVADYETIGSLIAFLVKDCCRGRREVVDPIVQMSKNAVNCSISKGTAQ